MYAFARYTADLISHRRFCLMLVSHDIKKRYRRSAIGSLWIMVQPLIMATILTTILGRVTYGGDRSGYFIHVLSGLVFWNFVSHAVTSGCGSIRSGENYILHARVPLAVYPLRTVLVGAFSLGLSLIPVFVVSFAVNHHVNVAGVVVSAASLLALFILGWSVATILGLVDLYLPDLSHAVGILLSLCFYVTPIIWPADLAKQNGVGWFIELNPLAALVTLFRYPFTDVAPTAFQLLVVMATTCCAGVTAIALLVACGRRVALRL